MSQPTVLDEDPTVIEDSQVVDHPVSSELSAHDCQNLEMHKPEGEGVFTVPQLPFAEKEPVQKKARLETISSSTEPAATPSAFRVKWVQTAHGLVPFVRNEDTQIVHCGLVQMKVFSDWGGPPTVLCKKGCHWDCPGHTKNHCGCHCHLLQWHYQSRE